MKIGSRRHQEGSETVEFAISATLLFLLLFGIIEFSVALFDKATLTNASREGARTGILFRPAPRDTTVGGAEDAAIEQAVRDYAEQYLISLGGEPPDGMEVSISRSDASMSPGSSVTVTVDYAYQFLLLPGFVAGLGDFIDLSATTVMRAE
ncbi:TadE/TadG family type IV pilus assembly protein [Halomonas cerina]|uniref:Flp pilus assembly protein TadG n=1 Tax=Halomonas cerina TaxID=447424 RepID=A0A839V957_9GAMM|nr:TadE/TadG family type IV pilus assembly protein [Halomonas cerina]MBB3189257.1 Flp pilus assembly protein TadG [Halomonas cerina]